MREVPRRAVVRGGAALGALGWIASMPGGPAGAGVGRVASVASRRVGSMEVLALLDASGSFPASWEWAFPDAGPDDWAVARALDPDAFGEDGLWQLVFHCFMIRGSDGALTLVDTGVGPVDGPAAAWAPVPGRLPAALAEVGIDPRDVRTVVLTHLHEDHVGWVVNTDGFPLFPQARYLIQAAELDHLRQVPDPAIWDYAVEPLLSAGQLDSLAGRTRLLKDARNGESIVCLPTPGHTVGHQSVLVRSGERQVFITGDVLVHAVQLANPDVSYRLESDHAAAARTRRALLSRARTEHALLATCHLTDPFFAV